MAHFKLFKLGVKKAPDSTRRDPEGTYRSSVDYLEDEGGYLDPTSIHATQPPTNSNSSRMPNYPPPRPYPDSKRLNDNSQRSSVPANFGDQFKAPQPKPRTQRPHSAGQLKRDGSHSPRSVSVKGAADDYCDPWDAKKGAPSDRDDYSDPWDAQKSQPGRDNYSEPWDSKSVNKGGSKDDYSDPWDSKNRMEPKERKNQGRQDYCDPWDAKKPQADAPLSVLRTSETPSDSEEEDDSYCEPYDTGKVAVLDKQAKNMSLKGMRLSSHEPLPDYRVSSTRVPQSPHVDTRPADDYECPWESKAIPGPPPAQDRKAQDPSQDTRPVEDYECPWESKAIDAALRPLGQERKEQNPTQDSRPLDDYDKPWEWNKKSSHWGVAPTAALRAPTTVQAPSIDQRPQDDYDKPWEWNKKSSQLSAMMTGQPLNPSQSAPAKPPRSFQESDSTDPRLPLEEQCWYHGPLARVEAEQLLRDEEDCSFLVRNSESSKNDYSLSVRNNKAFMHLRIVCQDNKYILGQFSKPFETVPAMIHHYSINKLNIKGAEHKILLHPVRPPPLYNVLEEPL